jgi:BlaI family penicillinase repressor
MSSPPRISDTEWEVMRVIWNRHPITASEVIRELAARDPSWHPKTVRTLLNRLVHKKALGYEQRGRAYLYSPRVNEEQSVATESESFLDRVFGGALKPMLSHFVEKRRLSKQELEELRQLLQEAGSGAGLPPARSKTVADLKTHRQDAPAAEPNSTATGRNQWKH